AVVLRERAQDLLALRFLFAGAARLQALQFIHAAVDVAARLLDLLIERAALRRLALEDRKQAAGLAAEAARLRDQRKSCAPNFSSKAWRTRWKARRTQPGWPSGSPSACRSTKKRTACTRSSSPMGAGSWSTSTM